MKLSEMTTAQKIEKYVQLRDHKKEVNDEVKKRLEAVNKALEMLEVSLLDDLHKAGGESIKADTGTVYVRTQESATVKDRDAFMQWLSGPNGDAEALDVRANKKVVSELMAKGEEVPGVKFTAIEQVGVRRK